MIINYLIEDLLGEARFDMTKPEDYKFYGVDSIKSESNNSGDAITRLIAPYIFVFNEHLYDMDIKTIVKYPVIKTENGFIRYDVSGNRIMPVYVDSDGEEYDLTNNIIKSDKKVQAFLKSVSDNMNVSVILDWSFDISEDDPSYDPSKSFDTIGGGSAQDVFRKLNNIAYIIKDYISNFARDVKSDIDKQVFGPKYSIFSNNLKYNLTNIEFVGKQDYEGDMKRTNLYKKWFAVAGKSMGNIESFDVDDVQFDIKYNNTRIA